MSNRALIFVSLTLLANLALAAWILSRRPGGAAIDLARVGLVAAMVLATGVVELVAARAIGGSWFLPVALAYVDLMVLVPLVAIVVLVASRRVAVTRPVKALAWASLLLVPIGIDATFVEPFRLVTETTRVPILPERRGSDRLVIAVLSDLQCTSVGAHEREAVDRALAAHPDLILLPGDLMQVGFDHVAEKAPELHALFARLEAPLGAWFVQGNCETKSEARILLAGTPVRMLDNEVVSLVHGDRLVTLCGVDLAFGSPEARAALHEIEQRVDGGDVRIVLAHRPDVAYALSAGTRVDLVVAGHTHGGQVRLPWFGPPITLSSVPREVAGGGLHDLDGRRIYVSRGIGWEHGHAPRVRFLCPPEVSILVLESDPVVR